MFGYCDKWLFVTLLSFHNSVTISDYNSVSSIPCSQVPFPSLIWEVDEIAEAFDGVLLIETALSEVVISGAGFVVLFDEVDSSVVKAVLWVVDVDVGIGVDVGIFVDVDVVDVDTVLHDVLRSHLSWYGATT